VLTRSRRVVHQRLPRPREDPPRAAGAPRVRVVVVVVRIGLEFDVIKVLLIQTAPKTPTKGAGGSPKGTGGGGTYCSPSTNTRTFANLCQSAQDE